MLIWGGLGRYQHTESKGEIDQTYFSRSTYILRIINGFTVYIENFQNAASSK